MSIKNNFLFVCLFASLVVCIIVLRLYYLQGREQAENCIMQISIAQRESDDKLMNLFHYIEMNRDISIDSLNVNLLSLRNILIYRFSEEMCDECVNQDLLELYHFQKEMGRKYIFIFPLYEQSRNSSILLQNKLRNFGYKNLSERFLKFPIHRETGLMQRYMVHIDSAGRIASCFFPVKNQQDLTRLYLHFVKERFDDRKSEIK